MLLFCAKLRTSWPGKVGKKERVVVNKKMHATFFHTFCVFFVFFKFIGAGCNCIPLPPRKAMASKSPSPEF